MSSIAPTPSVTPLVETESAFDREQLTDGWTRFTVRPARGPRPITVLWLILAALPWIFWLQLFPHNLASVRFFVFISCVILALWLVRMVKLTGLSDKRQPGGKFDVGPQGVRLPNGTVVARDNVIRLLYQNALDGRGPSPSFVVVHGPLAGYAAATQAAGAAQQQRDFQAFLPLAYRLDMEHGGRATCLAGGMTEATAYALYVQVAAALGLTDQRHM